MIMQPDISDQFVLHKRLINFTRTGRSGQEKKSYVGAAYH